MSKILTIKNIHGDILPVHTLDAETFYQDDRNGYSLRNPKLTTCTYVRDPRFKCHGFSHIDPVGITQWVTHKDLPNFFASIDWAKSAVISHHAAFDHLILSEHYGVKPAYSICTMSMSYGEFGCYESGSLKNLCKRLGLANKLEGELEKTSNIYDLSLEQETALAVYAIQDSVITRQAFEILYFEKGFPADEMHLINLVIKCFVDPVLILNSGLCEAEIETENIRIHTLLDSDLIRGAKLSPKCSKILIDKGIAGVMRSRPCFAELLLSRGITPPKKHAKTSDGALKYDKDGLPVLTYAFSRTDIELQSLIDDERVSDLVLSWSGLKSTIYKTKAENLLAATDDGIKPLCIPMKYNGAHTFRFSGWDAINIQALPSGRNGRSTRLREAIEAPPSYVLCAVDSAAIECRVNAWLWGQSDLLHCFANKEDPYSELASALYGVPVRKQTKYKEGINAHLRPVGKAMELGLGFGMSFSKYLDGCLSGSIIGEKIDMTPEGARAAVDFYRNKRNKIIEGWDILKNTLTMMAAKQTGFKVRNLLGICNDKIFMPNELYLHYKNIHFHQFEDKEYSDLVYQTGFSKENGPIYTRIWGSKCDENLCQSLARIIVTDQALKISKRFKILLLVHDEIVYLAKEEEAEEALAFGLAIMKTPPKWAPDIPLDAEGNFGKNYGAVK